MSEPVVRFCPLHGPRPSSGYPACCLQERTALASPAQPGTDPDSPQWEACKVCGGDHWTKDHLAQPGTDAAWLDQPHSWRYQGEDRHAIGCCLHGPLTPPPSEPHRPTTLDGVPTGWCECGAVYPHIVLSPPPAEPTLDVAMGHIDGAHNHNADPVCRICGVSLRLWPLATIPEGAPE